MKTIEEIKEECRRIIELGELSTKGPWIPSVWGTQILTGDSWQTICVFNESKNDHRLAEWGDGSGKAKCNCANADLISQSRSFTPIAAKSLLTAIEGLELVAYILEAEEDNCHDESMNGRNAFDALEMIRKEWSQPQ